MNRELTIKQCPRNIEIVGTYQIITLSNNKDIINREDIEITSSAQFLTFLEDINKYNNEQQNQESALSKRLIRVV